MRSRDYRSGSVRLNDFDLKIIVSLIKEYQLRNNILHGKYTEYHPNGLIKLKGKFSDGIAVGHWRFYTEAGYLISESWYSKDGTIKGIRMINVAYTKKLSKRRQKLNDFRIVLGF